jgi:RNA polymerase sigma factor (sigma-70 family)
MNVVLRHLRRAAYLYDTAPVPDGQLLERFLADREEEAFEALVRRHGPMVLGVCRRVLRNEHDVEDVFQATFLVLVRKAASIKPRDLVGHWLYGVAYRTAIRARALEARRRLKERTMAPLATHDDRWQEVLPLLDQELNGLPEKYRIPVVLCDLEGKKRHEVARALGCPEGTLSSRLARARLLLARRLSRRGVVLSGGALAGLVAAHGAVANVPATLASSTTRAALSLAAGKAVAAANVSIQVLNLTEGVAKAMLLAKLKTATVVFCGVAALGLSAGGVFYQARAGAHDSGSAGQQPALVQAGAADTAQEVKRLRHELEAARAEIEKLVLEARQQQERAEMERRRAAEALAQADLQRKQAHDAELAARRQAERTLYATTIQQAERAFDKADLSAKGEKSLALGLKVAEPRQAQLEQVEKLRHSLQEQLVTLQKKLEWDLDGLDRQTAQRREELKQAYLQSREKLASDIAVLDAKREDLRIHSQPEKVGQAAPPPKQTNTAASNAGDKLDRILERLERLEQRLDRMERSRAK